MSPRFQKVVANLADRALATRKMGDHVRRTSRLRMGIRDRKREADLLHKGYIRYVIANACTYGRGHPKAAAQPLKGGEFVIHPL